MVKGMKPIFQEQECLSEATIQGYLSNRLSRDERHRVENHMLDCPLCSDAVEGFSMQKEDFGESRERRINWRYFAVAAAIFVLLAAVVWLYSGPSNPGSLFAEYYELYNSDLDIQFRQSEDSALPADTPLSRGLRAYAEEDFSAAIPQLEAFIGENPGNAIARFYLGMAQMEESRWEEAEKNLTLVSDARLDYWEEASWYLSLLYVKNERLDEAKHALVTLVSPGSGRYYEKARKLLSEL